MPADDDRAIHGLFAQMEEGWNQHDGAAYARVFAEDADFIAVTGLRAHGRETIARGHQEIFDTVFAGTSITLAAHEIRYLRPDVALVDATSTMSGLAGAPPVSHPFAVAVKDRSGWSLCALHNMVPTHRPPAGPVEEALASGGPR